MAERSRRRPAPGIRVRATIAAAVVFSIALTAGVWFVVDRQRGSLVDNVQTTAELRADDLAAALEAGEVPASLAVPVEDEAFAQIIDDTGQVVRSSPNIEGEPALVSFAIPSTGFAARTVQQTAVSDEPFRVVGRTASTTEAEFTILVGASLEEVHESVGSLTATLVAGASMLLIVVTALAWLAVGRALRPVDAIRAEVERISQRELHRRVPEPPTNDEIGRLASTMNQMLERLDEATRRQRRFVADASHEMRSPLAGVRAMVEVDLAHPETADWQRTEHEVLDETLRLQRLVDDLLVLARADATEGDGRQEVVDLDDLVLKEARRLRIRGKVDIDATTVHPAQVTADPDAITRVIHNLLDNAERHASKEVVVSVQDRPQRVEIVVSDDGPGVPLDQRELIFERFSRSDDARARDHGGAGLGLAIAREIVTAHAGTLTLEVDGDQQRFIVRLPKPA